MYSLRSVLSATDPSVYVVRQVSFVTAFAVVPLTVTSTHSRLTSAIRDGKAMSLTALSAKAITMINGQGQAIAQPSTVASDGSSFTVSRTDATSTPSTGTRRRRP